MAIPVPNLDDRTFQDLVNEARSRIPVHCPEWTDHNLSDPGITLIELFAWMTELILYRLNKVPEKNYLKFLELIGVQMAPANPASTEITFRLAAPVTDHVTIPSGTEVATVRTETEDAIAFTTETDKIISPPEMSDCGFVPDASDNASLYQDLLPQLQELADLAAGITPGQGVSFFQNRGAPEPQNAFCLGYNSDLRGVILSLTLDCAELTDENAVRGIVPSNPPLVWEYWDEPLQQWQAFDRRPDSAAWLESDDTQGLINRGQVVLHIPQTAGRTTIGLRDAYWIRCKIIPYDQAHGSYSASAQLRAIQSSAVGCTLRATNVTRVVGEVLGISEGKPGQAIRVSQIPALPLTSEETVEVELADNSGWESWQLVSDFSQAGPDDKVFTWDPAVGEIQFGPAIRSQTGEETRYGATPTRGSHIRLTAYRFGGGERGNLSRRTLTVLKSSIPYVASVTNRRAAIEGLDPENIESAKMRGPQAIRTMHRAVTAEDFEYLAREASPSVGRVYCLQPRQVGDERSPAPGLVRVLLVPAMSPGIQGLNASELLVPQATLDQVREYLDERRLLSTALVVSEPEYVWVSVEAKVQVASDSNANDVRRRVEQKLYQFIHPLYGGSQGEGWPFGRDLFTSELYSQIQSVAGVEYTEDLHIFRVDPVTEERAEVGQILSIPESGLLCSSTHIVT